MPAVGDGTPGFWGAPGDVFPETRTQRCLVRKVGNVLNALPKSAQPIAKKMLAEIRVAQDLEHAETAAKATDDLGELLAFYDFPAEHWRHLDTTNPVESTFSTVRLRTKVTEGPGSRGAGLAMAFKLLEAAQDRWRVVNGPTSSPSSEPAHASTRG